MSKFIKTIKNKRYAISLLVTVLGLIGLISGTSYAILKGRTISNNEQIIKTGSVKLRLTENFNNIDEGVPTMTDVNGLLQETVYEFTVTNIGSVAAKYDLKLLNEAPSGETALSDGYIRLGLEVNGKEMGPMGLTKVNNVIDSNTINEDEVIRYKLRVWFDNSKVSELTGNTNKAYLKLKVEAKQAEYTAKPSGIRTVYRYGTNGVGTGTSITPVSGTKWIITDGNEEAPVGPYETQSECQTELEGFGSPAGYSCQEKTGTFGGFEYTEDYTTLNKTFFLKHNISSEGIVESSEVCYILNSNLYCLIGGDEGTAYSENTNILQTSFGQANCTVNSDNVVCSNSVLNASAIQQGNVSAYDRDMGCTVQADGYSDCQ